MLRIGVLVSGGGTNLQAIIDAIDTGKLQAEIACVVSSSPKAYALERTARHKIESRCIRRKDFSSQEEYEKEMICYLREKQVELIVMAGFLVIISPSFIQAFPGRIINIHPSLIPSFCGAGYYGLKVHEAVINRGVKITGATVHLVNEETDGGPIILQKAVEVKSEDTPETLQKRVMEEAEWKILPEAISMFAEGRV